MADCPVEGTPYFEMYFADGAEVVAAKTAEVSNTQMKWSLGLGNKPNKATRRRKLKVMKEAGAKEGLGNVLR